MAYTQLIPQYTQGAHVEEVSGVSSHYRLSIPAGTADRYRLAQLDDYAKAPRNQFPHKAPVSLRLTARVSSHRIPGTWGFGFWNYPFGMSLGFGGTGLRLPSLPNAIWFFGASKENYLSFRSAGNEAASNGFLAQSFRSPRFHPLLIPAGLALPFSRKLTRQLLGKVIGEDGIRLTTDPTQWHSYQLDWQVRRVSFSVDGTPVFGSSVSPNPPLGLVIWIDNQYATFTPEGKIGFGVLENTEPAWLEVKDIDLM